MLRYQLAEHRTWALAMLGRAQAARQWLGRAEKQRADLAVVDAIDEQDLVATRARTLESCGQVREAMEHAATHAEKLPEAFVTGSVNLVAVRPAARRRGHEARGGRDGRPSRATAGCSPRTGASHQGSSRCAAGTAGSFATPSG